MAVINPGWITKEVGSFQTAEEMNTLATAVKNNAVELQTDITNLSTHINNKSNPHEVTKIQLGLENVDNVSDANKPVSIAQATALNGKVNNTGNETINGVKTFNSSPIIPVPTTDYAAVTKSYVDGINASLNSRIDDINTSTSTANISITDDVS